MDYTATVKALGATASAISAAAKALPALRAAIKRGDHNGVTEKVNELAEQLGAALDNRITLALHLDALRVRVQELERQLDYQDRLRFKGNAYYFVEDSGRLDPYCPACFGMHGKLIHMIMPDGNDPFHQVCPICKTQTEPPTPPATQRPRA